MKRTPIKKKPYVWKRKPPKKKKGLFDHLKKESRNDEWNRIKREIRPFFEEHGLYDVCELQLHDICIGSSLPLQFAHSKKRNDIAKEEPERTRELKEVIRICTACHHQIEYKLKSDEESSARKKMYFIVTECIEIRNKRLNFGQNDANTLDNAE